MNIYTYISGGQSSPLTYLLCHRRILYNIHTYTIQRRINKIKDEQLSYSIHTHTQEVEEEEVYISMYIKKKCLLHKCITKKMKKQKEIKRKEKKIFDTTNQHNWIT